VPRGKTTEVKRRCRNCRRNRECLTFKNARKRKLPQSSINFMLDAGVCVDWAPEKE
jgi:hypothetical protein